MLWENYIFFPSILKRAWIPNNFPYLLPTCMYHKKNLFFMIPFWKEAIIFYKRHLFYKIEQLYIYFIVIWLWECRHAVQVQQSARCGGAVNSPPGAQGDMGDIRWGAEHFSKSVSRVRYHRASGYWMVSTEYEVYCSQMFSLKWGIYFKFTTFISPFWIFPARVIWNFIERVLPTLTWFYLLKYFYSCN